MTTLYATESWLQILFLTGILGGGAAWQTGRAIAKTWRPLWSVIGYMMLLGAAIRFVHFALFDSYLLAPASYVTDTLFLIVVGCLSWRATRATQMVMQYYWMYERTGVLTWRERQPSPPHERAA